ncbi:MAG: hypothetical protein DIU76_08295 [Bacillota bacterium]|nr:MAG: hypothetical protein DIU76_08295 [Bacillota bacterium]
MEPLARNGYTADEVRAALHGAARYMSYKYELLDDQNRHKAWLPNVLEGKISYNALAEIKRTARFVLREDPSVPIDWLRDRIRPWALLRMPRKAVTSYVYLQATQVSEWRGLGEWGYAEFPLGVFLLSSPTRRETDTGAVVREVEAYDQLVVLRDSRVTSRYVVPAGTNYIAAVSQVLTEAGIQEQDLLPTPLTLPVDREWEPGTTRLQIANDLLLAINYQSLYFDAQGRAVARPYRDPSELPPEYTYRDDDESVILPGVEEELDLWDVPNQWILYVSEPDREPLYAVYTNTNPASPTSTVNRGRVITAEPEQVDAADQATLDALAQRKAQEASQVYQSVEFETAIMPMHGDMDVLQLEYTRLGIKARYREHQWEMDLRPGGRMRHVVRRVVSV